MATPGSTGFRRGRTSHAFHERPGPALGRSWLLVEALLPRSPPRHPARRRPGGAAPLGEEEHVRRGRSDLVVIGRSGAGYDKIDLAACTENGVAVFNAPLALNHSTASSALMFMLALAKRLLEQDRPGNAAGTVRRTSWEARSSAARSASSGSGISGRELVSSVAPFAMQVARLFAHADPEHAEAARGPTHVTR